MVISVENQTYKLDSLFIWLIALLGITLVGGNFYFAGQSLLLRIIVSLVLAAVGVYLAMQTKIGKKALRTWREALVEVKKIVWPTKKETMQTTLGVLAMVLVLGIILWTVDSILIRGVAWILKP